MQAEINRQTWEDPQRNVRTLGDYFDDFLAGRRGRSGGTLKATTRALYVDQFERYLRPTFGRVALNEISISRVFRWYESLPDRPALRRQVYALLHSVIRQAIREKIVRDDPCQIQKAGRNPERERPYFTYSEVLAVIAELPEAPVNYRAVAVIAFNAHLRLGEVLALRRGQVDLASGNLTIDRAVAEVNNQQIESTTKTAKSRTILLDDETRGLLWRYLRTSPIGRADRLFSFPTGEPLRHFHVHNAWKLARAAAGYPEMRFHDLRHVSLTMLAEAGLPLRDIMHRAGHSTVAAAMTYQHRGRDRGGIEAAAFARQKQVHLREASSQHDYPDQAESA